MKLELIRKKVEAKDTVSFYFKTEKKFHFLPGQFIYITIPLSVPDSRGPTRHFTISSSPTESKNQIRITTRIRENSGFKLSLKKLDVGSVIEADGPNGTFILDENNKGSHVFLAGGIGITPFISMLAYSFDKKLHHNFHLLFSNSLPEEITFEKELTKWSKNKNNFKLDLIISKPENAKSKWTGLKGRLNAGMLKRLLNSKEFDNSDFWICGPPGMVTAYETIVNKLKIPASRVRSEKFTGY